MNEIKKKCISGKNAYETEREAQRAAELGMALRKGTPNLSYYRCLECYDYHLTSRHIKNKAL